MKTTHKTLLATAVTMGVMLPVGTITAMAEETKESPESQQPAVTEVAPVENVEPTPIVEQTPIVEETPVVQEQEPISVEPEQSEPAPVQESQENGIQTRGVTDVTGGEVTSTYTHTYYTKIRIVGNVTINNYAGQEVEKVKPITKEKNFFKGNISNLENEIRNFRETFLQEIADSYASRGTVTYVPTGSKLMFDHFGSRNDIKFDENGKELDKHLIVDEYQIYEITFDINVQENQPTEEEKEISSVDIGNVFTGFDAKKPVNFTTGLSPDSMNQMEIVDEYWQQLDRILVGDPYVGRITKQDPRNPTAGESYGYHVILNAKDGYIFSEGFKNFADCTVLCNGKQIKLGNDPLKKFLLASLSADRKELRLSGLITIKVKDEDPQEDIVLNEANIENVKFDYPPGSVPQKTAQVSAADQGKYEIYDEYWEEMVELESGELVPVAFWHSNDFLNNSLAADKRITSFEVGKRYMYSLDIRTKDGFTFANKDNIVNVNGKRVNSSNADKTPAGLFVVAINSITPKASEIENPDQPDQPSKPEQPGKPADGSENKPSSPSTETKTDSNKTATVVQTSTTKATTTETAKTEKKDSVQTGEATNLVQWVSLMALSFVAFLKATFVLKKK